MSSFKVKIVDIQKTNTLHLVKFALSSQELSMISLELDSDIKIGIDVKLMVKPTHIAIAKEINSNLSCDNQLKAKIVDIENGEILSSIRLEIEGEILEAIITYHSSKKINLEIGEDIIAIIQPFDLSIGEVL